MAISFNILVKSLACVLECFKDRDMLLLAEIIGWSVNDIWLISCNCLLEQTVENISANNSGHWRRHVWSRGVMIVATVSLSTLRSCPETSTSINGLKGHFQESYRNKTIIITLVFYGVDMGSWVSIWDQPEFQLGVKISQDLAGFDGFSMVKVQESEGPDNSRSF